MPDYKEMYLNLFRDVTKAIEILQAAQQKTEDIFSEGKGPKLVVAKEAEQYNQ